MKFTALLFASLAILFFIPGFARGQVETIEDQLERSAEALELNNDYSDLAADQAEHPGRAVKINSACETDLGSIPFLTPNQRNALLDHIRAYGDILSIFELQSVKGFDSVLIRKIEPYISLSSSSRIPPPTPGNLARFGHHNLLIRYEQNFPKAVGFRSDDSARGCHPDNFYRGTPQRYYFRYSYTWFDRIKIGFSGEKDPGEQFFRGGQSCGMDFYTGYLSLNELGILKNLTIGNFKVSFGQGLTLGSGLSIGAVPGFSMNPTTTRGIRPSSGLNEGAYFRGIAATIKIKPFEFSVFASYHPRDATVTHPDSVSNPGAEVSSFVTTGYHRSGQELSKRNKLTELVCGGNISFTKSPSQQLGFRIGVTGVFVHYSARLAPSIVPYNRNRFTGNENYNFGLDYQLRYHGLYLFGEISRSKNGGTGLITGASVSFDSRVSLTAIYRCYQAACSNLNSTAFFQNGVNSIELGLRAAIPASLLPNLSGSGDLDSFTFPS